MYVITEDKMKKEFVSMSVLIADRFKEIFNTTTISAIHGNTLYTLTEGLNSHLNPVISIYSTCLDSKTPFRCTDIIWDASNDGEMWIGIANSMSIESKKLLDYIEELCKGYEIRKYVTRGR